MTEVKTKEIGLVINTSIKNDMEGNKNEYF